MQDDTALSPLAVAALALLAERPMHPYEMYQVILERHEDRIVKVSAGTLYRTIERLQAAALAEATGTTREGNRPERTTYAITDEGRAALVGHLRDLIRTPVRELPPFVLGLAEMHNAPKTDVVDDLRHHLSDLSAEIDLMDTAMKDAEAKGVAELYLLDGHFLQHMRRAQHDWVTTLLHRLTKDDISWP